MNQCIEYPQSDSLTQKVMIYDLDYPSFFKSVYRVLKKIVSQHEMKLKLRAEITEKGMKLSLKGCDEKISTLSPPAESALSTAERYVPLLERNAFESK